MKYMVASDIHGSAYYCRKLIEAYNNENPDKLVLLGDILYHGPRNDLPKEYNPKKVITMLNNIKHNIVCVRGNCDAEVDQMVLDFPIMADYNILSVEDRTIYATHGHIYNKNSLPPMNNDDILLHGHTHVPVCENINDGNMMYMNPGSVSIPKEESQHSYMIIEEHNILWKNLDGKVYMDYKI